VRKIRRLGLSLVLAVLLALGFVVPAMAGNPTVTIYVSAKVVSISNSQATWNITVVAPNAVAYFSANNLQNNTYSQITNTGNVAVDVTPQCTDFVASNVSYNWELDTNAGDQAYSLYFNTEAGADTYNVEIDEDGTAWINELAVDDIYDWSAKFTAPTVFHVDDDGSYKQATITLVSSAD